MRPLVLWLLILSNAGCALWRRPPETAGPPTNPFFVAAQSEEEVWERTVDVIHDYFEIARENRLDGVIETKPKVGSSLLEPWQKETIGFENRLESTLQSIRRRAFIHITPTQGGYLVTVEVFKEQEDVPGATGQSVGGATFQENKPLQRDLGLVVGQSHPDGWIPLGRDPLLEANMLAGLQKTFGE